MKPVTIVALSFALAVTGTWAAKKQVSTKQIAGGAFLAIIIAIMESSQPKLAQQFSWVILAGTLGAYGQDVFDGIGKVVDTKPVSAKPTTPYGPGTVDTRTGRKPV